MLLITATITLTATPDGQTEFSMTLDRPALVNEHARIIAANLLHLAANVHEGGFEAGVAAVLGAVEQIRVKSKLLPGEE